MPLTAAGAAVDALPLPSDEDEEVTICPPPPFSISRDCLVAVRLMPDLLFITRESIDDVNWRVCSKSKRADIIKLCAVLSIGLLVISEIL